MLAAARRTSKAKQPHRIIALVLAALIIAGGIVFALHRTHDNKRSDTSTNGHITKSGSDDSTSSSTEDHTDAVLNTIISNWQQQNRFTSTVTVRELSGQERTAESDGTTSVVPASTYKIYVAYALLHAIEQGTYTLNTKTSDGNTIQADLTSMIVNSDNNAARTLGFLYGWKNINALLQTQGINNTDLYNYVPPSTQPAGDKHTTSNDLAKTLELLYDNKLLNQDHTQLLLNLMKIQNYRQRIPAGVPSGTAVADKPGWLTVAEGDGENVQNDAAIVYGPKSTYILVITTTGTSMTALANLSQEIYNHLET